MWVSQCACVCVCVCLWVSVCVCLSMWVSLFVTVSHVDKARICSAEEWLSVCVCLCDWVYVFVYDVSEWVSESAWVSAWVSEWVCVCVFLFVMMSHVDKAWICSAEEFLELCGKVEAVVRNCMLRWSGHLFEVRKGRGGGQELSAEVIRAPVLDSYYPPFRSVFLF